LKLRFSPSIFAVAFCCAYIGVFAADWPLFRYYPLHGDFNWGPRTLPGVGPAMAWYGLVSAAGVLASVSALLIPERLADRLLRGHLWLFPLGAMLGSVFLLRRFFQ
jgi:hypothetical protein